MAAETLPFVRLVKTGDGTNLACPHCGTEGLANLVYVEDISNVRDLVGIVNGMLVIEGLYKVLDDDGSNPRLGCKTCDKECVIPEEIEYDFR